jgi:hypothetical protein
MRYEVDFLPARSGGAAVCVRWGRPGHYKVLVYDGGTELTGERLVAHIRTHYMCSHVDYMVSSHPARDHTAGLSVVLRQLKVGELWMHRPWATSGWLRRRVGSAYALEQLAQARRVPVMEPFAGATIGPFRVLSPRREHYFGTLLPGFGSRGDEAEAEELGGTARWTSLVRPSHLAGWGLPARAVTTPENESSAVLYGEFGGRGVLLTGRAGREGLHTAADLAEQWGIDLPGRLRLFQVPNEGHPDHLSAALLDRIVGPRLPAWRRAYTKSAFISVSLDAPPGLGRAAAEALKRRGVVSFQTWGMHLHHGHGMPYRGWFRASPAMWES